MEEAFKKLYFHVLFTGSRLLAISNSLSKEEVKQIKFLAKHEISNDRYAQISKAYEVFGELEKDGKFPIGYIAQLLVEVKRNDLALKLGIAVPLTQEEEGQGKVQFIGLWHVRVHSKIVIRHDFQGCALSELGGPYCLSFVLRD